MSTLINEVLATKVKFEDDLMTVHLNDGRILSVPLAWYPRLVFAKKEDLDNWRFIGGGEGINWPALDEDLSVSGMLRGR